MSTKDCELKNLNICLILTLFILISGKLVLNLQYTFDA